MLKKLHRVERLKNWGTQGEDERKDLKEKKMER